MRILMINRTFWPDPVSAGIILSELSTDLSREHEVTVLAGPSSAGPERFQFFAREKMGDVDVIRAHGTTFSKSNLLSRMTNLASFFMLAAFAALFLVKRPDVIVVNTDPPLLGLLGALLKRRWGCKFVYYCWDIYPDIAEITRAITNPVPLWFLRRANEIAYARADRIIVIGDDMRRRVEANGAAADKISVIRQWANCRRFDDAASAHTHLGGEGKFVVMYFGNLGITQQLEVVIETAERLRNDARFSFVLVGDGIKQNWLRSRIESLGLTNVTLLPYPSLDQSPDIIRAGDIHLIPLREGLAGLQVPYKVYGVLAAGRPFIAMMEEAADVAQIARKEGVGFVIPPDDVDALVDVLLDAAGNQERLREMGRSALKLARERFDRDLLTGKISDELCSLQLSNGASLSTVNGTASVHMPASPNGRGQIAPPPVRHKPHLLIMNRSYWPAEGATGQLLRELSEDLAAEYDITFIAGPGPGSAKGLRLWSDDLIGGVRLLRTRGTTFARSRLAARMVNLGSYYAFTAMAAMVVKRPDVVIAQTDPPLLGLLGAMLKRRWRCKFVYNVRDLYPDIAIATGGVKSRSLLRLLEWANRNAYASADLIIAVGDDMRERILRRGISPAKVVVSRDWADCSEIRPVEPNKYREQLSGKFIVMYSGNLGLSQQLETVLDAARDLRDDDRVVFQLIGRGARRQGLEEEARRLDLRNVRFADFRPGERLAESLSSADLHLIPLLAGAEGGIVPSKAYLIFAAGRPFVAMMSAHADIAVLARCHNVGFVIRPGDTAALVRTIRHAVENRAELIAMGERARALALAEFDRPILTRRFAEFLTAIVTSTKRDSVAHIYANGRREAVNSSRPNGRNSTIEHSRNS